MRKAVYQLLTSNVALTEDIPAERWYERGSVADSPRLPFAVLAWGGASTRGVGRQVQRLEVWVYDKPGDIRLINRVLARVKALLDETTHYVVGDERLVVADFQGSSPDLPDDVYRATVRNIGYNCVGTGV
jgi:hypothetical protein